jgi:hypothetical protein
VRWKDMDLTDSGKPRRDILKDTKSTCP